MKILARLKHDAPEAPNLHTNRSGASSRSDRESGDAVVSNFLLHWFPRRR